MSSTAAPLPRSDRLRIGSCTVDISLREVRDPAAKRPRRITPKSLGVLLALVENAGRVVSRDNLMSAVWPDTTPTDDVVTQAVTQLRKAFGQERDGPLYIETIAKGGYRLLAEVEWLEVAPEDGPGEDPAPAAEVHPADAAPEVTPGQPARHPTGHSQAPRGRRRWLAGVVLLGLPLLLVLLWWVGFGAPGGPGPDGASAPSDGAIDLRSRFITSSPGFELAPTLSPDASLVVYSAIPAGQRNVALMVQTTTPTTSRQLTRPTGQADDFSPAWSPDGREIAFLRVVPDTSCEVLVMPATGGSERLVGECDVHHLPSFDWSPDGRSLLFGSHGVFHDRPGLHLLDIATGRRRAIEYNASDQNHDFAPRYSPDGRWIVFVRNTPVGDFWRIPAGGGEAERITRFSAQIRGWDWSPEGDGLVYSLHRDNTSRLYRWDLASGEATDLGIADAEDPATVAGRPALAYVHRSTRFGIYRYGLDGRTGGERLFASSGRERLAALAPDARHLAFTSDRSGQYRLWWADLDDPGSLTLLNGVEPESRYLPAWSSDSRRLLVVGREADSDAGRSSVFEVEAATGRIAALDLPVVDPLQALYASPAEGSGDDLLVVAADAAGRQHLVRFTRSSDGWSEVASLPDVSRTQVDPESSRVFFTRPGESGLWEAGPSLGAASVRRIREDWPGVAQYRSWGLDGEGGFLSTVRMAGCPALLQRHDGHGVNTGPEHAICLDDNRRTATYGFSLDRRNDRVYVTLVEHDIADIGFATYGFRASGADEAAAK